jgi:hypothetical protein
MTWWEWPILFVAIVYPAMIVALLVNGYTR